MWTTKRRRDIKFPCINMALILILYIEDSRRVEYKKLKRQTVRERTAKLSLWKFLKVLYPRKYYIGRRSKRGKRAILIIYNTYREHTLCLLLLFEVYILLNCFGFKTAYLLKQAISFRDKSNQLLLSLLNNYIKGLQNKAQVIQP